MWISTYLFIVPTFFALNIFGQQNSDSPCPKLFQYEPRHPNEPDKWYGNVILKTDVELVDGVWLILVFDKPSLQLGTRFGQKIYRLKSTEYMIQNIGYRLVPNEPVEVKFYVKFNPKEKPPRLVGFRINARLACPEPGGSTTTTTTEPAFITSGDFHEPTQKLDGNLLNVIHNIFNNTGPVESITEYFTEAPQFTKKPIKPSKTTTTESEIGFYQGDIALSVLANPLLETIHNVPCGKVAEKPIGLIAHGHKTSPGQWPWHVALYNYVKGQQIYSCGGSLVSRNFVLTAAHCVTKPRSKTPVNKNILLIFLGKHNLKQSGPEVQEKEVSEIMIHPDFQHNVLFNDIALLKLTTPAKFSDFVRPICIWDDYTALDIVHDRLGTVVGWGFDENKKVSDDLRMVEMPVVPTSMCVLSNGEFFSKVVNDNNYCAGFRNETSVCNGDSGGGMVFPKSGSYGQNTIWQIRGLVSIGVALQGQYVCDNNQYIVFTDVAKYLNWIHSIIDPDIPNIS